MLFYPYLSVFHLLSPMKEWLLRLGPPPVPQPQASARLAGPALAVRGQGRGSGNPLAAPSRRARAKGLSKQSSHRAGGLLATGVLSHLAAAAAGRRLTGNRKMCIS